MTETAVGPAPSTEAAPPTAVDPGAGPPPEFAATWTQFLQVNQRKRNRTVWMILGIALFALASWGDMGWAGVAILVGVVMFHELGHLTAMWAFGYRDLAVFFIPFPGAVATGRNRDAKACCPSCRWMGAVC